MLETTTNILLPVLVTLIVVFLSIRLRFFGEESVSGRWAFLIGGVLLVLAAVWHAVAQTSAYGDWFLASAYPWLDLAHFFLVVTGLILGVVGLALYADWWQLRREDLELRDQKLSILDNLQRDARGPYQLVDLLNISVKEIISHLPECAGAVFLINRKARQFILTASVGLSRDETAAFEYFPLQRNLVSQSIDVGEPMLGGSFSMQDRSGTERPSRFESALVLPLVSGVEKIGGILLLSEDSRRFSRSDIRYLQPVAEWIAEKIKSARLERDAVSVRESLKDIQEEREDLVDRVTAAADAMASREAVTGFCRSLVGLSESRSVHLFGLVNGSLQIFGGSEPLSSLSENFRTALVDALGRTRPLVINQEGVTEDDRPFTAFSNLIVPLGEDVSQALWFRREDTPFRVGDRDLGTLQMFSGLARMLLYRADADRLDLNRRKGFDAVLQLLRFDREVHLERRPSFFPEHMETALPPDSRIVLFQRRDDGSYRAGSGVNVSQDVLEEFTILPGEGIVGQVANRPRCEFAYGRGTVGKLLESFDASTRERLQALFGERSTPTFVAACPVQRLNRVPAVVLFFLYDVTESERGEWERMLTLATSLYSIRLTIAELNRRAAAPSSSAVDSELLGRTVNQLNNHLSAVIGNAELAFTRTNLSGDAEEHLRSIIAEAEEAARFLKDSLGRMEARDIAKSVATRARTVGDIVGSVLRRLRVAEGLYMAGGRAREIHFEARDDDSVPVAEERLLGLVEEALNRFGSASDDDDVLTLSLYKREEALFLDISRHRKNFPPVEEVAGFGSYRSAELVLGDRPSDTFLRYLSGTGVGYTHDKMTQPPSYLSFRFPLVPVLGKESQEPSRQSVRILAIDDQTVILDLISAMSQSMGYEVHTASSGSDGIALARRHDFSIVLTDLAMPGMSGLEVAAEIKKLQPETPIVLVTGWEVATDPGQLEACGIIEVLYKPFRIEQLTDIIRKAVASRA